MQHERPMTKTSTNLIGIVKHLTGVTAHYLISSFGRDRVTYPWEEGDEPEYWYGGDMWAWSTFRRRIEGDLSREEWITYNKSRSQ